MFVKRRKQIKLHLILFICSFIIIFSRNGIVSQPYADDVYIENYYGDLKRTNPHGGFFINSISGSCEIKANGGPIKLGNVKGDLVATTSAGDIEINEARGNVKVITQAGNILIKKAHGNVYAETFLGEIAIHSAKSVEVNNIFGGDVKLFNISGYSRVMARGNILLVANKKISVSTLCDLSSTKGDITLYLPEDFDANIEVKTPITEDPTRETLINSDFYFIDFKQRCTEEGKTLFLTTRINKGGAKISLYIENGDIYLKVLKPE